MDLLRMVQWKGEAMELYGFTLEVAQQTESACETQGQTFFNILLVLEFKNK